MLIIGEWWQCDDGVVRPILRGKVAAGNGVWSDVEFLLDTGADRTVFSAATLWQLALATRDSKVQLSGVGGPTQTVAVNTTIRFRTAGGDGAEFKGGYYAFTDPFALDMSVLGRNILDLFAVIVDRPGNFVGPLGQNHGYAITSA
jgi:hypothetical protein